MFLPQCQRPSFHYMENMPTIFSVEESKEYEWARTLFANGVTFYLCRKGNSFFKCRALGFSEINFGSEVIRI
jgi:hypothetical protein